MKKRNNAIPNINEQILINDAALVECRANYLAACKAGDKAFAKHSIAKNKALDKYRTAEAEHYRLIKENV